MHHNKRYNVRKTEYGAYFIGSNTGDGFRLSPDPDLSEDNCSRLIIIKGGPGTGKSTLMKSFSGMARSKGYDVTEYYCSSDPSSLDAVRAVCEDRSILVCDGTAPHVMEMKYPGAVSSILDLSSFWDSGALIPLRGEITDLTVKKKLCFERAASALHASCVMANVARGIGVRALDIDKLNGFAYRTASKIRPDGGGKKETLISALSMKGAVTLDTYIKEADEIFCLEDCYGTSDFVLHALSEALDRRGVSHEASLCPEDPSVYEALYISGIKRLYTVCADADGSRKLNCARFVTDEAKSHRSMYRFAKKCSETLISGALAHLSEAERYHFALESIYAPAMDFDAIAKCAGERLFSLI